MRVRLTTSRVVNFAGTGILGSAQQVGDVIEVSKEEGRRLIKAQQAEPVEERIESATVGAPASAILPRPQVR